MTRKPETRRQRKIRDGLEKRYHTSFWWKVHGGPFQRSGLGDLCGCVFGIYCNIEVKEPGEPPSVIQEETIEDVCEAGGVAGVVETLDEAIKLIDDYLVRFLPRQLRRIDDYLATARPASAGRRKLGLASDQGRRRNRDIR